MRSAAEKRNNDCREIIQETWPVCHPDLDIVTESRPCRPSLFWAVEEIEMNKSFSKSMCLIKPRLDLLQVPTSIPKNMSVQFKTLAIWRGIETRRLSLEIVVPLRFDHCFWFGDLNYRLDLSSDQACQFSWPFTLENFQCFHEILSCCTCKLSFETGWQNWVCRS